MKTAVQRVHLSRQIAGDQRRLRSGGSPRARKLTMVKFGTGRDATSMVCAPQKPFHCGVCDQERPEHGTIGLASLPP